jgi:hypothetical protein
MCSSLALAVIPGAQPSQILVGRQPLFKGPFFGYFLWALQRKYPGCRAGPANQNRRVAPRQAPHFLSKRPQKVRKKGLSPAEGMFPSPTPGEFFTVDEYRSDGGFVVSFCPASAK